MSPTKDSAAALARTRKQRKRFKRKVKIEEKRKAQKLEKLKEKQNVTPLVKKYWLQRYDLFSNYDLGIKLDEEGWFSVTPEEIAARQARRCATAGIVIDAFAGVGGNSIQFAKMCHHVVAVEIDPKKVALAFHNAKIYGVEDYIDFIVGDFFELAPFLKGDVVFLSPPWGGPSYKAKENYTLDLLKPKDGHSLFQVAQAITPNIIMYLPRNIDMLQASELSWLSSPPLNFEIEENFVRGRSKGITVYFGGIAFPYLDTSIMVPARLKNLRKAMGAKHLPPQQTAEVDVAVRGLKRALPRNAQNPPRQQAGEHGPSHGSEGLEPIINLEDLEIPDHISDLGHGASPAHQRPTGGINIREGTRTERRKRRRAESQGKGKGKVVASDGEDTESSDEEAQFADFPPVDPPHWRGGISPTRVDGMTRSLSLKPDNDLLIALYNSCRVENELKVLATYETSRIQKMFATAAFGKMIPVAIQAFQRVETLEAGKTRYKEKYRNRGRELRALRREGVEALQQQIDELNAKLTQLEVDRSEQVTGLKSQVAQKTAEVEASQKRVSELEGRLEQAVAAEQQSFSRGLRTGFKWAEDRLRERIRQTIEQAQVDIGRHAVQEFVEGPAFNQACTIKGVKDFEIGFNLAVNQIKSKGFIPDDFDYSQIGLHMPDPYPAEEDAVEIEDEPEVDWTRHPHGFVVERLEAERDGVEYKGEVPQPVDFRTLLPNYDPESADAPPA